jgi:hypothetical protein
MISVLSFPVSVEQLVANAALLPSVERVRPRGCPSCGRLAHAPDAPLGMIGHGTYTRQIRGLPNAQEGVIPVRRFLCTACGHTVSVLPDELYPGRLYTTTAILLGLVWSLLRDRTADDVRGAFAGPRETAGWKTLRRWRRGLLAPLWGWLARSLSSRGPARTRTTARRRLRRLLARFDLEEQATPQELQAVAGLWARTRPTVCGGSGGTCAVGAGTGSGLRPSRPRPEPPQSRSGDPGRRCWHGDHHSITNGS